MAPVDVLIAMTFAPCIGLGLISGAFDAGLAGVTALLAIGDLGRPRR